jgi:HAMP domain-containing protein
MFEISWLPAFAGAFASAVLLIAEHWGMKRWQLKRTDAYIAGVLALALGYFTVMWFTHQGLSFWEFWIVTTIGGATVKTAYWIDRWRGDGPVDENQLQEILRELERLNRKVEAKDVENRVLRNQISDFKAIYITIADIMELADKFNTMLDHTSRITAVGQAGLRLLEKIKGRPGLPDRLRGLATIEANRRSKSNKEQQ